MPELNLQKKDNVLVISWPYAYYYLLTCLRYKQFGHGLKMCAFDSFDFKKR